MTSIPHHRLDALKGRDMPSALLTFLGAHRGQDVSIQLDDVDTLTGRQIEVILSGDRQWQTEGHVLSLTQAAPKLITRLIGLGLPARLFSDGG